MSIALMTAGGRVPAKVRKAVFDRDGDTCAYCGVKLVSGGPGYPPTRTIDHDVPVARGGGHAMSNLVAACSPCNNQKGNRTGLEYLRWRRDRFA